VVRVLPPAVPEPALSLAELPVAPGVGRVRDLDLPLRQHGLLHRGLVPDIAALRDASTGWRRRIYAMLALGWEGADNQWRHYGAPTACLAALATPLVLSVHSVVSWDFAMALVPGWHSTLFAPFFVDGAIFSGFAMVLVLGLPMRHFFKLHAYIQEKHLDAMGKLILGHRPRAERTSYLCEIFTSLYSGEHIEKASLFWKVTQKLRVGALDHVLLQLRGAPRASSRGAPGPVRSSCTSYPSWC